MNHYESPQTEPEPGDDEPHEVAFLLFVFVGIAAALAGIFLS